MTDQPYPWAGDAYAQSLSLLGSPDTARRITALDLLERIAEAEPARRQEVVDPICAYLRAPVEERPEQAHGRREPDVRLAAQRILVSHLRTDGATSGGSGTFWPGVDLDLRGASLVGVDFRSCQVRRAAFAGASFRSGADFRDTVFAEADFRSASFFEGASFREATFAEGARFDNAMFDGTVDFARARFAEAAHFDDALFVSPVSFEQVSFLGEARFSAATFYGPARFGDADCHGAAWFDRGHFVRGSWFRGTTFHRSAHFDGSMHDAIAHFEAATFHDAATFDSSVFNANVSFRNGSFRNPSGFHDVRFSGHVDLSDCRHLDLTGATASPGLTKRRRWPHGWTATRDRDWDVLRLVRHANRTG